jgi:uncharacterized protein (DUF58 family)
VTVNPQLLERLRQLKLIAQTHAAGLLSGQQRSKRIGAAVEFCDYQRYEPGMDLRHFDWGVLAKSDKRVVRRYQMETDLQCTVVLDLSADITAGESAVPPLTGSKAGFAVSLAATLITLLSVQGESVGLELLGIQDQKVQSFPCRTGGGHLDRMMLALASALPGGRADLKRALGVVGERTRRRSWVALISDGQEEPSAWLPTLGGFGSRGTEVVHLQLYDPREWSLLDGSAVRLYSPEGGDPIAIDCGAIRDEFTQVVSEFVAEVRAGVQRAGGRHILTSVLDGVVAPIQRAIDRGSRRVETQWG